MKSDVGRLCDIRTLRELRKVRRANDAARNAVCGRMKLVSLKVLSLGDVMMLLVEHFVPADMRHFVTTLFSAV